MTSAEHVEINSYKVEKALEDENGVVQDEQPWLTHYRAIMVRCWERADKECVQGMRWAR